MEALLTPLSTFYRARTDRVLTKAEQPDNSFLTHRFKVSSTSEALEILKSEPDRDTLTSVLHFLKKDSSDFSITSPSPLAAQLVHVLVSDIVPNYWHLPLASGNPSSGRAQPKWKKTDNELLISCLRSVTGLNALLLSLKQLIQRSKEAKNAVGGRNFQDHLTILLQVLTELIQKEETAEEISNSIWNSTVSSLKQKALWNEFLSIIGSGKLLGLAAEAEDLINMLSKKIGPKNWIADGSSYSSWLARNITYWAKALPVESDIGWKCCSELLCKAFRLGHSGKQVSKNPMGMDLILTETILKEVLTSLLFQLQDFSVQFERLLSCLPNFEQRNLMYSLLKLVSRDYLSSIVTSEDDARWWQSDADITSAAAGLIALVLGNDESRKDHLMTWLTSSSGAGVGDGIAIRRSVLAAIATNKNDIEAIFDKSMKLLGDQLYIRHTPSLQQEGISSSDQAIKTEC